MSRSADVALDQRAVDSTPVEERPGLEALPDVVSRTLLLAMEHLELERSAAVGVLLSDDEHLKELNRSFRDRDATTDVLSFRSEEGTGEAVWIPEPEPPYLGDIAISVPEAGRGARKAGHSLEQEVCLLAVHGLLHLIGHNDATPEGAEEMERLEVQLGVRPDRHGTS